MSDRPAEPARLELVGTDRLEEVRELWLALHHHHRRVVGALPLVEDDDASWRRRSELYRSRMAAGSGLLVLATIASEVVAYAFVCIEAGPDDTFPVGDRYADVYSLSVAERFRGRGVGTALLDFVDGELARMGIVDLKIEVMVGNDAAQRLYERRGFMPAETVLYRIARAPAQSV